MKRSTRIEYYKIFTQGIFKIFPQLNDKLTEFYICFISNLLWNIKYLILLWKFNSRMFKSKILKLYRYVLQVLKFIANKSLQSL